MTSIPDWLVERSALDEVPAASRERAERADKRELAERIAAVKAENAAELAAYPAGPAVAQIEARVAAAKRRRTVRRIGVLGAASTAAVAAVLFIGTRDVTNERVAGTLHGSDMDDIRVKGPTRLLAFRHAGDHVERLDEDAPVHAGDRIQLSYNGGGQAFGLIASVDGAGVVTLHYPVSEDAPPEATALAKKTTALPNAYALDDAPSFERFFFITSDGPIDVKQSLATLHELAHRADRATATLDLPPGFRQQSLRLRKAATQKAPTP